MKSIISIALAAVMLLSVLTGCGRKNKTENNAITNNTPAVATTAPAATNKPDNDGNGDVPGTAGNATDRVENGADNVVGGVENGVNDVVGGVENGVNDVVDGMEGGMDDLLGDDGLVNGDMDDGRVEDDAARVTATPQAR